MVKFYEFWSNTHHSNERKLLLLLCGYVFLTQFTPSEPYLVPYLTQVKHFTNKEVTLNIFPISVYSMLVFTLLAAPACALLSYRTTIIIGTFGKFGTFLILLLGKSLFCMQLMQVTYALGYSIDMVFSSFLFVLVREESYGILTSATQATSMVSFVAAAELGQILVSQRTPLGDLLYVTIVMVGCACLVVFFLPEGVPKKKVEHDTSLLKSSNMERSFMINLFSSQQRLNEIVQETWKGKGLQMLSFWWAFQIAGSAMVVNYATNIFYAIDPRSVYNGHVIAASQGVACLASLVAIPLSNVSFEIGSILFASGSALCGSFCLLTSWSKSIWIAYPSYVLHVGVNQLLLCLLYVKCAKSLSNGQYALLFSLNTMAAYIVQSMFQAIVEILNLTIFDQFNCLATLFFSLAITFAILCFLFCWKTGEASIVSASSEHLLDGRKTEER